MTTSAIGSGGEPRISRGRIAGPSRAVDRRINAVRDDLADAQLAGVVVAARYAGGVYRRCAAAAATLHRDADADAIAVSQLLHGEIFVVFDLAGGWAWGQCLHDRYVGWVQAAALTGPGDAVSHRVAVPAATVFAAATIKARVAATLPLNARVVAGLREGDFVATADGFVHHRHLRPVTDVGDDPVALALGFVGTPYVWGGRTRDGIDCSGLTQAVLRAAGLFCPRDSDQQAAAFAAIAPGERRRGDLVVFPGHVGILADAATLVHANAWWMATVAEPLADVVARLAPTGFHRPPVAEAISCSRE